MWGALRGIMTAQSVVFLLSVGAQMNPGPVYTADIAKYRIV